MDALEELQAIERIRQLKMRYFRFVDTKDWEGLATLFCTDAVFDTRGAAGQEVAEDGTNIWRGRQAILDFIRESMQWTRSVHHGHGHEVTLDSPTEAHGVIAMEDFVEWEKPFKASLRGYGHYHETYRIEDDAWKIWRSKLTRLRVDTDLPAEVL
jgi:hypothetical protein